MITMLALCWHYTLSYLHLLRSTVIINSMMIMNNTTNANASADTSVNDNSATDTSEITAIIRKFMDSWHCTDTLSIKRLIRLMCIRLINADTVYENHMNELKADMNCNPDAAAIWIVHDNLNQRLDNELKSTVSNDDRLMLIINGISSMIIDGYPIEFVNESLKAQYPDFFN